MGEIPEQPWYFWDEQVLELLLVHGTRRFARLNIWEPDYEALAKSLGRPVQAPGQLRDPRGGATRLVHRWLARTQAGAGRRSVRQVQRAMKLFGW